jgi:hypothetical protein
MTEHVKHFPELRFTVVAKPNEYHADFLIYNDYDLAEVLVSGHVKWDGCSNWWFGDGISVRESFHGCERKHLLDLGHIMAECWDWTKELCAHWNAEVAE